MRGHRETMISAMRRDLERLRTRAAQAGWDTDARIESQFFDSLRVVPVSSRLDPLSAIEECIANGRTDPETILAQVRLLRLQRDALGERLIRAEAQVRGDRIERKRGERIGPWTLKKNLGSGGNGEVWKSTDETGREVALKILHRRFQEWGGKRYARFRDEGQKQRQLSDIPGVLPIVGMSFPNSPGPNNPPWLATALATPIRKALRPAPTVRSVVGAIAAIASTLASLHAKDVSHRDIKPRNLYRYNDCWALGDFGLITFPGKGSVTTSGERLGPQHYIAPEMIDHPKTADPKKADVYSLAKTLYVLATEKDYPPPGVQLASTLQAISKFNLHPRAEHLDLLIEWSTQTVPDDRPTMAEFAEVLVGWLRVPDTESDAQAIAP
jgi:serine/threonine protein kinase